jgi:uncharacterized protein (TIGR02145 family)
MPVKLGTFTDVRDGYTYKTVEIGGKTWFAENLRFKSDGSSCFGGDESNEAVFGRRYSWDAASAACPDGWRVPTFEDWDALLKSVGGKPDDEDDNVWYPEVGIKLKAKDTWETFGDAGVGEDAYGFRALPDGFRNGSVNGEGQWWSSTESDGGVCVFKLDNQRDDAYIARDVGKEEMLGVRCVREV